MYIMIYFIWIKILLFLSQRYVRYNLLILFFLILLSCNTVSKHNHYAVDAFDPLQESLIVSNYSFRKNTVKRHLIDIEYIKQWELLKNQSYDPSRSIEVTKALNSVAGVYKDAIHISKYNTRSTVLVNVISYDQRSKSKGKSSSSSYDNNNDNVNKYQQLLQNWFCFISHFGLKSLIYIVPVENVTFIEQVNDLKAIGITSEFLSYPTEKFWSIIMKKRKAISLGSSKADYQGNIPSFQHFGALIMLVPILEVLEYGYDAIYLDVDVVILRDPIPYLMFSHSDYSISLETRDCFLPSEVDNAITTDWKTLEPNTGVMRIKSNIHSIQIYYKWLQRIIDENVINDQKMFEFEKFGMRLSYDCNPSLQSMTSQLMKKYIKNLQLKYRIDTNRNLSSYVRYCYLNEYLIQNGKVAFHCTGLQKGNIHLGPYYINPLEHPVYPAEYLVAINKQNFSSWNIYQTIDNNHLTPSLIHVNYCGDKITELRKLGSWLPHKRSSQSVKSGIESYCRKYTYQETIYAKIDWKSKLYQAKEEMVNITKLLYNGSIIKISDVPFKRMYIDGKFRVIMNQETLYAMGLQNIKVHYVGPYNLLMAIPEGKPFKDLKTYKSK